MLRELGIERMAVLAVDLDLLEQREGHPVGRGAELLDLLRRAGFLPHELVARHSHHEQSAVAVLLRELLERRVLRGQPAFGRDVDDENRVALVCTETCGFTREGVDRDVLERRGHGSKLACAPSLSPTAALRLLPGSLRARRTRFRNCSSLPLAGNGSTRREPLCDVGLVDRPPCGLRIGRLRRRCARRHRVELVEADRPAAATLAVSRSPRTPTSRARSFTATPEVVRLESEACFLPEVCSWIRFGNGCPPRKFSWRTAVVVADGPGQTETFSRLAGSRSGAGS